jgi:hypothetical protein
MLGKLLKYDMNAGARMIPISYLAIAVLFVIGLIAKALKINQVIATACILLTISGIAAMILTFVFVVMRFHKSLFGNEGYLTQTLPVGKGQLLLSKVISSYIWMVFSIIALLVAIIAIFVILNKLSLIKDLIDFLFGGSFTPLVIFTLVIGAVQILAIIGEIYFAITLANTRPFIRSNIVFSIVFFFIVNFAVGLLELVAMLIIPLGIRFTETGVIWTTETMLGSLMVNIESLTGTQPLLSDISIGVGSGFADLAAGIVLLLLARWLMTHKTSVK